MGIRKKVKALIKDDRPAKLKSFLSSQDVDPCGILFSRGRNALHYCAEFGSADMMRCLLRLECDPMRQDRDGKLPLHTALYRLLKENVATCNELYDGMIDILLSASPMSQDVEDKDGATCHDLIKKVKNRLKYCSHQGTGQASQPPVEDEKEWMQKLSAETQFEFEEQQPRYDFTNDYFERESQESFSSWSERMYQEYRQKRQGQNARGSQTNPRKRQGFSSTHENKNKKPKPHPELDPEEKLRRAREEMRKNYKPPPVETANAKQEQLLSKKEHYEKKFIQFFNHPPAHGSVTFGGIPWPCTNMDKLADTLFCDLPDKESSEYRKFLRKEQVRWHPDKFLQKFRDFLHPNHMEKIMTRVKGISQTLNSIAT